MSNQYNLLKELSKLENRVSPNPRIRGTVYLGDRLYLFSIPLLPLSEVSLISFNIYLLLFALPLNKIDLLVVRFGKVLQIVYHFSYLLVYFLVTSNFFHHFLCNKNYLDKKIKDRNNR